MYVITLKPVNGSPLRMYLRRQANELTGFTFDPKLAQTWHDLEQVGAYMWSRPSLHNCEVQDWRA